MGTYCQVITSKWLVCCELARRARGRSMGQELASLKSGKRPVCPRFPWISTSMLTTARPISEIRSGYTHCSWDLLSTTHCLEVRVPSSVGWSLMINFTLLGMTDGAWDLAKVLASRAAGACKYQMPTPLVGL